MCSVHLSSVGFVVNESIWFLMINKDRLPLKTKTNQNIVQSCQSTSQISCVIMDKFFRQHQMSELFKEKR